MGESLCTADKLYKKLWSAEFLQRYTLAVASGKLVELLDDIEKAKYLYRLVLKHHRGDVKKVELYYDSLSKYDTDYFVPIEYYYELVEYRKSIDTLRPPVGVLLNMGYEVNSQQADYGPYS
jgi:hypothetical protein